MADGRRSKAGERRPQSRPTSRPGMLLPAALLSEVSWLHLCSCVLETSLLHSLFCTRSTWCRSRCNIKSSSAKRLLCASIGDFVFVSHCFSVSGSLVAAVDGRHASSSSASRRRSVADRHLTRRSRLLPCARCSARSRRGVARVATYTCQRGDSLSLSSAKRLLAGCTCFLLVYSCFLLFLLFQVLSFSFYCWLRPSTGPVAWVPFGRVGWRHISSQKTTRTKA